MSLGLILLCTVLVVLSGISAGDPQRHAQRQLLESTATTTTTLSTTTTVCADGAPIYNSCADYASIKTCGGVNCCTHGKAGSVRRRSWAGDAKENCYLSCGYCTTTTTTTTSTTVTTTTTTTTSSTTNYAGVCRWFAYLQLLCRLRKH